MINKLVVHCYPHYIADWSQSERVAAMTLEERGLYRELLDLNYAQGSLPDDPGLLRKLARCQEREFKRAWPRVREGFELVDGRLHNRKVDRVLKEIATSREKRTNASAKAHQKRWHSDANRNAIRIANVVPKLNHTLSHPLSHPLALSPDELCDVLSDRHRKKGDRGLIGHILVDIVAPLPEDKQKETLALINSRHSDWCQYDWLERDVKFIPKLSNWLREGGWRDDPEYIVDHNSDPGPGVPHASEIGPD